MNDEVTVITPQNVAESNGRSLAPASATPMEMLDRALSRGADADTLSKLMDLQERWERNQGRKAFDAAMSDAKAEIPPIKKNRHVGFKGKDGKASTDYDHEDLAEIARTIDPILAKHGLSYRFRTAQTDKITVTCIISHRDGHYEETQLSCHADTSGNKNSIQSIGSAVTYLQRYTLKSALGLAASNDDDDGKSAETSTISDDQIIELGELAESVGADSAAFCKYLSQKTKLNIEILADIPASYFDRAKSALNAKKAQK